MRVLHWIDDRLMNVLHVMLHEAKWSTIMVVVAEIVGWVWLFYMLATKKHARS